MNKILEMIHSDDDQVLERGIRNGIPVDMQIDDAENLLQYAVKSLAVRCTSLLIRKGADPYAADASGRTLLHILAESVEGSSDSRLPEMIEVLCRAGLSFNRRDENAETPFFILLHSKHCDDRVISTAIEQGADARTDNSYALYKCESGRMMEQLVKKGAVLNDKDISGIPLLHAITRQTTEKLSMAIELVLIPALK